MSNGFGRDNRTIRPYSDDIIYIGEDGNIKDEIHDYNPQGKTLEFENGAKFSVSREGIGWDIEPLEVPDGCDVEVQSRDDKPKFDVVDMDCETGIGRHKYY